MSITDGKSRALLRAIGWGFVLLFAIAIITHLARSAVKGDEGLAIKIAVAAFIGALALRLGYRRAGRDLTAKFIPWTSIPIVLTALWAVNSRLFGKFDISATLFHMRNNVQYDGLAADIAEFALFGLLAFFLILSIRFLGRRDRRVRWADRLLALPILLINPLCIFIFDSYFNPDLKAVSLSEHYVQAELTAPKGARKNLMIIYLESVEDSYSNPVFGDAFDGFDPLIARGLHLGGVTQIQDTGWTIAGIVSSQCGVPLLSYGLMMHNRMKNIDSFLPGAHCLASALGEQGYQTVYYGGADLDFAGKGRFLKTHGYQDVRGTQDFKNVISGPIGEWGIYDDDLFDQALLRLGELEAQLDADGQPYLFSILTLAAHFPKGYPAPLCKQYIEGAEQMDSILLSVRCTAFLTQRFLSRAKQAGYLKNTTVVLLSDHLAHKNTQYKKLQKIDRQNFALIMEPHGRTGYVQTHGSMIDMYPTLLELTGYGLPERRQGLGISLLSGNPTLVEQYGVEMLDKVILGDKELRARLWDASP